MNSNRVVYSGKMGDSNTWFEEYADHTVKVRGSGALVFNIQYFRISRDKSVRYNVIVKGPFYRVADSAFLDFEALQNVVLPYTIEKIGDRVFSDCDNLKSVTMPGNVMYIGKGSFMYSGIEQVNFYDDLPVSESVLQFFKVRGVRMFWRGSEL